MLPAAKRQRGDDQDMQDGLEEVGSGLALSKPPAGVPHCYNNNYTVRLTYADTFRHDVDPSGGELQVFRLNSIFDPDYTGTGHQPFFRDMWASQYDYYSVIKTDYEIHVWNAQNDGVTYTAVGTNSQRLGMCVITTRATTNDSDLTANASTVFPNCEMKGVTTAVICPEEHIVLKGSFTPGDFIVDAKDADADSVWTAMGSNPAVPRYFGYHINQALKAQPVGVNENVNVSLEVFVKLNFTVQFTQINPSLRQVPS